VGSRGISASPSGEGCCAPLLKVGTVYPLHSSFKSEGTDGSDKNIA